jgi:serine protease Do
VAARRRRPARPPHPDQAGLRRGDVITAFAGQPVTSVQDVTVPLGRTQPGQVVPLTVARGTNTITVTVTIGERPPG